MSFELTVSTEFAAAHNLREYDGSCERLHGHNWKVEVAVISNKLDKLGMAMDFREIKTALNSIMDEFDHYYLNELKYFCKLNPTTENIAMTIFTLLEKKIKKVKVSYVRVWESPNCSAIYRKGSR